MVADFWLRATIGGNKSVAFILGIIEVLCLLY